ncbi:MAG: universal stress protein [Acidobacteriota bacterium]|jgi:nucleotide-binding universal stress UspA family protein
MKILLAVDGSKCSDAAIAEVARQPWPAGSEVRIITVAEMPFFPSTEFGTLPQQYYEELEGVARDRAYAIVEKAVEHLKRAQVTSLPIDSRVIFESPREAIVDEAVAWGADLIVVGSHGYRGYKRFLLGSVSQTVAAHAPCSVMIVREQE